jgi:hypothetical protein
MKKIEISNRLFQIVLYIFLIYGLLANLLLFTMNFVSILKLVLGIAVLILLIIKHEKVKVDICAIAYIDTLSVILHTQ